MSHILPDCAAPQELIHPSENIHLQPYSSETDFYERIYPKYLALLDKAKVYLDETEADPERTIILVRQVEMFGNPDRADRCSAGFDACEHEYQAMQRHDRRVPVSPRSHVKAKSDEPGHPSSQSILVISLPSPTGMRVERPYQSWKADTAIGH